MSKLIKIDVEGMELGVLKGGHKTIKKCKPFLYVENNCVMDSKKLILEIDSLGYALFWDIQPYYNPRNFFGNTHDIFPPKMMSINMLGIPSDRLERSGHVHMGSGGCKGWQVLFIRLCAESTRQYTDCNFPKWQFNKLCSVTCPMGLRIIFGYLLQLFTSNSSDKLTSITLHLYLYLRCRARLKDRFEQDSFAVPLTASQQEVSK